MRFRAESHLRRPTEFAEVRRLGRRFQSGGFVLWATRRPAATADLPPTPAGPRVGFVASRRAVGNAIARNRAKRRLREVFRQHQQRVPPETDLVIVARSALNRLEYVRIEQDFLKACANLFPVHSD